MSRESAGRHETARAPHMGDPMPDFSLPDSDGRMVSSVDLLGRGPVVLFFYPRDESPGCTVEACAFRDAFAELVDAGATVVGISADTVVSHARFADRHRLPYMLLSDDRGVVARRFGVRMFMGLWPGRETFVIDQEGIVRGHLRSMSQPQRHVALARRVVARINGRGEGTVCAS